MGSEHFCSQARVAGPPGSEVRVPAAGSRSISSFGWGPQRRFSGELSCFSWEVISVRSLRMPRMRSSMRRRFSFDARTSFCAPPVPYTLMCSSHRQPMLCSSKASVQSAVWSATMAPMHASPQPCRHLTAGSRILLVARLTAGC